jgi:hypothetical protein
MSLQVALMCVIGREDYILGRHAKKIRFKARDLIVLVIISTNI